MSTKTANVSRRLFIEGVGAFAATTLFGAPSGKKSLVNFGLVTDCHYADLPLAVRPMPVGDAAYRDSLAKMREFVSVMNRVRPAFAIELGDFKDQGPDKAATLDFLEKIEGVGAFAATALFGAPATMCSVTTTWIVLRRTTSSRMSRTRVSQRLWPTTLS